MADEPPALICNKIGHSHGGSPIELDEARTKLAMVGIGAGFFGLLLLANSFGAGHSHSHSHLPQPSVAGGGGGSKDAASAFGPVAFVALGVHSFVDGAIISSAFSASQNVGMAVGLAIVLHKLPDGFVLSTFVLQSSGKL